MTRRRLRGPIALSLAIAAALLPPGPSGAGGERLAGGPACAVSYSTTELAGGGFEAEVLVRNGGNARIGWTLRWEFTRAETVTEAWNAEVRQQGAAATATNLPWNAVLISGGAVLFGFRGRYIDAAAEPPAFTLDGTLCNGPPAATGAAKPPKPPGQPPPANLPPAPLLREPSGRLVVGYFPSWAHLLGLRAQDVDFGAITHLAHFSATPRPDGTLDLPASGGSPSPELAALAHQRGVRLVLVVGGFGDALTDGFARLAADAGSRRALAANLAALLDAHGYDGVDLDWEYPADAADRANLTALVAEVRAALGPDHSLSLAVPASAGLARWYDLRALAPYVDWFGVMTYDLYAAAWSEHAEHHAPLYSTEQPGRGATVSVDSARAYYMGRGVAAERLLIGLPFYGQRYDGADDLRAELTNPAGGPVDYRDIVPLIGNGWTLRREAAAGVPYLRRDERPGVLAFDDPESIEAKCAYVAGHGLGGAIIWHLGLDRIAGEQPLLQAARACR